MANNYVQFSEKLVLISKDEIIWWTKYISLYSEDPAQWDDEGEPRTPEAKFMQAVTDDTLLWGFEASIKMDEQLQPYVWFHSEESSHPDHLAKLMQLFLKEMRPNVPFMFTLSWADTCSRMLIGEFGGGALTVTKDDIRYFSAWEWLSLQEACFDKENACTQSATKETPTATSPPRPKKKRRAGAKSG